MPNYFESKFVYKRIPVYDASTSDLRHHADDAVAFISSGLCHGSVLVHCQRGVSRSATCVAFYLMRKVGMTMKGALALIREKRPDADPIPAFISQLETYEKKCIELGVISKDSSKRKIEERDQKEKKKQRRIGPQQRVIGPSLPAKPSPAAAEHDSKIYGPQLPTAVALGDGTKVDPTDDHSREKGGDEVARESISTKGSIIGPSLPPNHEVNK